MKNLMKSLLFIGCAGILTPAAADVGELISKLEHPENIKRIRRDKSQLVSIGRTCLTYMDDIKTASLADLDKLSALLLKNLKTHAKGFDAARTDAHARKALRCLGFADRAYREKESLRTTAAFEALRREEARKAVHEEEKRKTDVVRQAWKTTKLPEPLRFLVVQNFRNETLDLMNKTMVVNDTNVEPIIDFLAQAHPETRTLVLSFNKLTRLPDNVVLLNNLRSLVLSGNQITALPESIGALQNLRSLVLIGNPIKDLPKSLSQMPNLAYLDLRGTGIKQAPKLANKAAQAVLHN